MSENPILDELVYEDTCGSLRYKGVRYLLIRPETITGFQKALLQSCGQEAREALFDGGFTGGSLSAKKYKELHNFSDNDVIDFMMRMGGQIGWGHFNLELYDPRVKMLRVSVADSAFAEAYGKSTRAVCDLIRGVLSGMACVLFQANCHSEEVECSAKGDSRCLFVIKAEG